MAIALTDALRAEYLSRFDSCEITRHKDEVEAVVQAIGGHAGRYRQVEDVTGVPWYVVAVIHAMEASLDFATHLHNGDPLDDYTVHVPAGRPSTHEPPFTWEESAADALEYDGLTSVETWDLATVLYRLERFNGMGYRQHHVPSPYLWSYSNHYTKGKYGDDGVFDPELVSRQPGAAVMLHLMAYYGTISIPR